MPAKGDPQRRDSIVEAYRSGAYTLRELASMHGVSISAISKMTRKAALDGHAIRSQQARDAQSASDASLGAAVNATASKTTTALTRGELAAALGVPVLPASATAPLRARLIQPSSHPKSYVELDYIQALTGAMSIDILKRLDYDLGRSPGQPSSSAIVAFFGSWNEALRAAGLPTTRRSRYGSHWSEATLIQILKDFIADTGSTSRVSYTAWRAGRSALPSAATIIGRFDQWSVAVRRALA